MYSAEDDITDQQKVIENIEKCANNLILASLSDVMCNICKQNSMKKNSDKITIPKTACENCEKIKNRVMTFNNHICGFSCHKRKKTMTVKSTEGHGILDGQKETDEIDHLICRFNYPQFPSRKKLVHTRNGDGKREDSLLWSKFQSLTFL